jgi:hypothetical protein
MVWLVKCLGGCGNTLRRGSNSWQKPLCRRCRRRRSLNVCEFCNQPFHSSSGRLQAKFCCLDHLYRWRRMMSLMEKSGADT